MGLDRLELTSGLGNTARSAFGLAQVNIVSFRAAFVYQDVSGAGGADGATFCIQNAPAGAAAIGGGGGSLGYATAITPSVALAFNIFANNTRGIRFLQGGVTPAAGAGAYTSLLPAIGVGDNANPIQVNLTYSGANLTAVFKDTVTLATLTTNATVNIPNVVGSSTAYVGFTGADGGTASTQVISNFTMLPGPITLSAQHVGNSLVLSWSSSIGAYLLSSPSLSPPAWTLATDQFALVGNTAQVTVSPLNSTRFYKLQIYP
jgi:hypothetical protein